MADKIDKKVRVSVDQRIEVDELGDLTLKGFHRAIPAFNVRALVD